MTHVFIWLMIIHAFVNLSKILQGKTYLTTYFSAEDRDCTGLHHKTTALQLIDAIIQGLIDIAIASIYLLQILEFKAMLYMIDTQKDRDVG